MPPITPSQTVGPYFAIGLTSPHGSRSGAIGNNLVGPDTVGERIRIEGRVLDGDGVGVNDALLEIWQADAHGRYAHPADGRVRQNTAFFGFGRSGTDANGAFVFQTIKPGRVPGPNGTTQAPHILMAVFARGMLCQRYTRIYFAGEPANSSDPVLAVVPQARRATLLARPQRLGEELCYGFDVHLQGEAETVFFDL